MLWEQPLSWGPLPAQGCWAVPMPVDRNHGCLYLLAFSKHVFKTFKCRLSWISRDKKCCPGVFKIRFQSHFHLEVRKKIIKKKGDEIVPCSAWGKCGPSYSRATVLYKSLLSIFLVWPEAEMNWNFIRPLILMTFKGPLWKLINIQWVPCC